MDDEDEFQPGIDGCHHGLGWDEECEWCDIEDQQERAVFARMKKIREAPQLDWLYGSPVSAGGSNG